MRCSQRPEGGLACTAAPRSAAAPVLDTEVEASIVNMPNVRGPVLLGLPANLHAVEHC